MPFNCKQSQNITITNLLRSIICTGLYHDGYYNISVVDSILK